MNVFKKKLKEWVYSISTEDHYAEYNPDDEPNFNMGMRSGQSNVNPSSMNLAGNASSADLGDSNGGENSYQIDDFNNAAASQKGVSEILLAWRHIDAWTDKHNPDLNATLSDPCTQNDITHAEEDLEISLPPSVRASLRIHDGQEDLESMTGTSGLIYGLQLMTLDQIVAMTQTWRNVAKNLNKHKAQQEAAARASMEQGSSTSQQKQQGTSEETNQFKLPYIPEQNSIPPNTIQGAYAHPAWIPLVTDNAGNHIGVDLAPAAEGSYGQVIIFGREFDTKFVVGDNWGEFMLAFVNDLECGNWYLIDDSDDYFSGEGELVFRDKKRNGRVEEYLEVLKRRALQKYKQSQTQQDNDINEESQPQQEETMRNEVFEGHDNDTDFDIDDESVVNVATGQTEPEVMSEQTDRQSPVQQEEQSTSAVIDEEQPIEKEEPVVKQSDADVVDEPVNEIDANEIKSEEDIKEPETEKVEEELKPQETEKVVEEAKSEGNENDAIEDVEEEKEEKEKDEAVVDPKEDEEEVEVNKLQNEFESVAL
ncbi:similar to Saccharomyces cerevisiae YGR229C SMI1 Protein involved in the regulation of cell wall synthesis [Maudiozyma saulgeensis]|uniref:Similar to Saccharomyces cerevisiae YGR229C SMI1 Protein involved in the regulation of cell wall synthesis n=1 Tax=Maudiozyma saulgeensis TaxID=1789683 RepID=A0A1X7R9S1_9SACH|nr:similar to Saccharomyces cerevisiae YGR229C SMI1 Protein involved in the regulation of cell wall synthesis [Kazachstania saulgeensis]